jgi:hypothetical protein
LYLKNRCFNFVNRRFNDLPQTLPPPGSRKSGRTRGRRRGRWKKISVSPTRENPIPSQPSQPGSPPTQGRSHRQESPPEKTAPRSYPAPPEEEPPEGATLCDPPFPKKEGCVTKLLRKRSRWRKNSVLSPNRARKLARSRLPQPRPPNPPRNPCFFRPTIPGLRAEQSSPTATAASRRPRAATEPTKGPRRACSPAELIPTPIPIPILHTTLLAPAPNRLPIQPPTPIPLPTPDFQPVRSPSERTSSSRSSPVSGPFAPLVSEPGHPAHSLSPAGSLP